MFSCDAFNPDTKMNAATSSVISSNYNIPAPPRKIALFVEPTPFTYVSGYSNRFKEMLTYLKKAGDKVEIVTTDKRTDPTMLPDKFQGFKIAHTYGFIFPFYNTLTLSLDLPEMKGAKMIDRLKPDLIHVTSPGFLILTAMVYARVMRIPLVASYHTHLPTYGKSYVGFLPGVEQICWWLIRQVHTKVDLTLVTSSQMRDQLVANGVPRVEVWSKGVNTKRFHPKFNNAEMRNRMTEGNPDDFLIVFVGRLGSEKRLKDIKPMLQKMPNARLCMVGKGPQSEELKSYFKGTNTHFTGQLTGDSLSQAFASADAFVMPSDSETLGFVVLEAMASGVPVVAANAGGIPDMIEDEKTSFLVPPGDTDAFVQRLTQLQDVKFRKKYSIAARKEALRWGWEAATDNLRNYQYENALLNFRARELGDSSPL